MLLKLKVLAFQRGISSPQRLFRTLLLSENVDLPPLKFVPEKNSFLKRKQVTSAQLLCV